MDYCKTEIGMGMDTEYICETFKNGLLRQERFFQKRGIRSKWLKLWCSKKITKGIEEINVFIYVYSGVSKGERLHKME